MKSDLEILIQHYEERLAMMVEEQRFYLKIGEFQEADYFSLAIYRMEEQLRVLRPFYNSALNEKHELEVKIRQMQVQVAKSDDQWHLDFWNEQIGTLELRLSALEEGSKNKWFDSQIIHDNLVNLKNGDVSHMVIILMKEKHLKLVLSTKKKVLKVKLSNDSSSNRPYYYKRSQKHALKELGFKKKRKSYKLKISKSAIDIEELILIISRVVYDVLKGEVDKEASILLVE